MASPTLMATGARMAVFADRLGISGPSTVPTVRKPAACALKVRGNRRRMARAMRRMRPLTFMPAPKPKALTSSHQVGSENAERPTSVGTPAITSKAAIISRPVAYSGSTEATHHTTAQTSTPRQAQPWKDRPTSAALRHAPTATPAATPAIATTTRLITEPSFPAP